MDDYRLLDQIGEGSFGRVYKARRKFTGRIVAIKMINKLGQSKEDLASFRREIDILQKVDHPNIMRLLDIVETPTDFCVVSELGRGDLFQIIDDNQTLPEEVLRPIAAQLLSALNHLHTLRIIHRDMKPRNILIASNGTIKICDFGFARALSNTTLALTSIKGTPLYMAPELVQEQQYDEKVDIWSLGIILYELYFGKPPFYTNSVYKLIQMIVNENIPWPGQISDDFKSFLLQMLQKDPTRRLSCDQLLQHPFVSGIDVSTFDDTMYRFKKKQFDEAIEEAHMTPFESTDQFDADYTSILMNPSGHSSEELLEAVKSLKNASTDSQLTTSFAYRFTEYMNHPQVLDESLKIATSLLKSEPQTFMSHFQAGLHVLSLDMPPSAIPFLTHLLVIPSAIRRQNGVVDDDRIDVEHSDLLRDKMLSFLFTSDTKQASMTYCLFAYLISHCDSFAKAICGPSVTSVMPIVTSAVIHTVEPTVTAAAFVILGCIVEKNNSAIQYIQPVSSFLETFLNILLKNPTDFGTFAMISAAMTFASVSFSLLSQLTDFQRMVTFPGMNAQNFFDKYFESNGGCSEKVKACLKFAKFSPKSESDYLAQSTITVSPFEFLNIESSVLNDCIESLTSLQPMYQPSLLASLFRSPDLAIVVPSVMKMFDSCADIIAEQCLLRINGQLEIVPLLLESKYIESVSQMVEKLGASTSPEVIVLALRIILAMDSQSELIKQFTLSLIGVDGFGEAASIAASQYLRLSDEIPDEFYLLVEREQNAGTSSSRTRALETIGNILKKGPTEHDELFGIVFDGLSDIMPECRRAAAFAFANAVYYNQKARQMMMESCNEIAKLLEESDESIVDSAVAIVCNAIYDSEENMSYMLQIGIYEKILEIMAKRTELAKRIIMRLPAFLKFPDSRKMASNKQYRSVILKYTKNNQDEAIKQVAQSIINVVDT